MGRVLVIGSVNTDLVCRAPALPRAGETLRGVSFHTYAGGKGANQAVAAARAGATVSFIGAVGRDVFGAERRADLVAEGIDVTRLRTVDAPSGTALIVVADDGENQIVIVPGANDLITPVDALAALREQPCDVLSLTLEIPLETARAALMSRPSGVRAVLNVAPFDAAARELLAHVDVLVCNELEVTALLGSDVAAELACAQVETLRALGPAAVVLTLGARGAVAATSDGAWIVPSLPVDVVDTTGAGDAVCGVLAAWLADGRAVRESVRAAIVAGALATTRAGAQPSLPRRADIVAYLDEPPTE